MNYRAYFQNFITETEGIVKYYGITKKEADELKREHKGKVSGSNGNYTVYDNAVTSTYLVFYLPEIKRKVRINVRDEILKISGLKKLSHKFIKAFKENMPKISYLKVEDKKWVLEDKELLEKVIKAAGY